MKKLLLINLVFLLSTVSVVAQNVARDKVIVEIATGTWCQYCPGAAMGADDLIANGHDVAIVEYHSGDEFQNSYSTSRISYYNVSGFPTAYFDGTLSVQGGNQSQSMYPQYLSKVNQRLAITSPFTIDMEGTHACFTDFTANISIEKVGTNNSSNLRLHAALTESHIEASWFGMHEVNFVCRKMVPNQNGTALDFSGGNTENVILTFALEPGWVAEECELVIFVQDQLTKEIFQGTKISLLDFLPEHDFDASILEIINIPETNCSGSIEPTVIIRNLGNQPITELVFDYYVNQGDIMYHTWTGVLDYLGQEEVLLPEVLINYIEDENDLVIHCDFTNGETDGCPGNNTISTVIERSMYTPNTVKLILRTDDHPEETTWELLDGNGSVLYTGGPYTTSGAMIQETFELPDEACHTFRIYDAGGDGFNTPGFYMLYHGSNTTISQGFNFGAIDLVEFNTTDPVGTEEPTSTEPMVSLYPNPVSGKATFTFSMGNAGQVLLTVFTVTGEETIVIDAGEMSAGPHTLPVDATTLQPGVYIYKLWLGEALNTGKILVR